MATASGVHGELIRHVVKAFKTLTEENRRIASEVGVPVAMAVAQNRPHAASSPTVDAGQGDGEHGTYHGAADPCPGEMSDAAVEAMRTREAARSQARACG